MSVSGKRVLVTGASRGLGRAIAVQLAEQGFRVTVHYRGNQTMAEETLAAVREAGGDGDTLAFDIGDRETVRETLAEQLDQHGAYWGVVLNAGINSDGPLPGLTDDDWDRVIHTNLDGFYNVLKPLVMPMIGLRDGGRIVTMSSLAALTGNRGQTNYAASKGGLIAATKSLAQELAKRKITVNSVAPGFIQSDMTDNLPVEELVKRIPLRRLGTPEDVAGVVGFLFSEAASYVTAQVISVNGGML